ncbi:cytochrome P450 [Dothidotthia symphoricarpi CBS 119687]|uniref:Cytochrome P450 n=1 Tax=Dothidotthia symphoricarpi CBS 119687 TaxID=1392245 RepID=A0A6A5ZYC4_9PLEO|nr:cytochrome P450 [Dothidotthia symphoricarpi CBS 119687]KAF2123378.1 cytochrome P450 [Dothidotthia symphoricarpi CBS 119687]
MALLDLTSRVSTSPTMLILVASVVLFASYVLGHTLLFRRLPPNAPSVVSDNYPITGPLGFWTERWSWFKKRRDQAKTGNFSFHAGAHTVIAMSGDKSRQVYFESRELGLSEGYSVLFGQAPPPPAQAEGKGEDEDFSMDKHFSRRLAHLLKNDQFRRKLPALISDVQEAIDAIKSEPNGITDPFESIYRIVFRLTIRVVGADEIADDAKVLEDTLKHFESIDSSGSATSVMFPKLPSPAVLKRTYAGLQIYTMIESIVKKRAASGEKHDDALQYMLDQGDKTYAIVEFIVGALFAGLLNSGINAAWIMCYLATSSEWLAKARDEVRDTAAKYAKDPTAPLRYQLNDVPLEAWEAEFPVIDLCLRESIRLNLLGATFRKNLSGRAIPTGTGDEVIPPGAFVAYAIADAHLDPEIYPDPEKWDPARYLPDRAEDKKKPHAFLGWGVGRHPCLGMRFAKLEQNIITAYFLASFDFSLEDRSGNKLTAPPKLDTNGHSAQKPKNGPLIRLSPSEK